MAAFPEVDWVLKTQPARNFSWRVRASGWIWGLAEDPDFAASYDLIIATSLSDVVALKALCPALNRVPLWVYFHENQFAHPLSDRQWTSHQQGWQFQSIQNALCADWVSFNSTFNRRTFFEGAHQLLRRFPERLPGQPLRHIEESSDVLPVPLNDRFRNYRTENKNPQLIVWNHRWEWDKQPERFLRSLMGLIDRGIEFELAMAGIGGSRAEKSFSDYRERLGRRVIHWGEADDPTYERLVSRAGIGVSTALHDFQGLAMLELAQAGATLVVPTRLSYPECLPGAFFYGGSEKEENTDVEALTDALASVLNAPSRTSVDLSRLPSWSTLVDRYRNLLETLPVTSRR